MGRSGIVGWITILLLLAAAFIVMRQSGAGAGILAGFGVSPEADSGAVSTDLDPRVQPFRTPRASGGAEQADRQIRDIEAMGEMYP